MSSLANLKLNIHILYYTFLSKVPFINLSFINYFSFSFSYLHLLLIAGGDGHIRDGEPRGNYSVHGWAAAQQHRHVPA